MNAPNRYLVIGNPIKHSLSPLIHTLFAQQTGQTLFYEKCLADNMEHFFSILDNAESTGIKGANITAPFKIHAFEYVKHHGELTERAALSSAVNTLHWDGSRLLGDNTDGTGLIRDFQRLGWPIKNKHIGILGAGGAVRGILAPLLAEQPASISLFNRTPEKAENLIQTFHYLAGKSVVLKAVNSADNQPYDILLNTIPSTACSEAGNLCPPINKETYCYDLNYHQQALTWAKNSLYTANGLGMLVEQAAESFFIWRKIRPETKMVLDYMRNFA